MMEYETQQQNMEMIAPGSDAVYDSLDSFAACFCCNPFDNLLPDFVALQGQAFDAIVVQSATTGRVATSDFLINFDHPSMPFPPSDKINDLTEDCQALLEIEDDVLGKVYFPIDHDPIEKKSRLRQPPKCDSMARSAAFKVQCTTDDDQDEGVEQGTLRLLAKMLKPGKNNVRYLFSSERRVLGAVLASVFLWSDRDRLVICDVDGTITKTNIRGIYDTIVTEKYVHCHDRVCEFLSNIKNGGVGHTHDENPQEQSVAEQPDVHILFLTSRPIFLAKATRKFLSSLRQMPGGEIQQKRRSSYMTRRNSIETNATTSMDHHRLPEGPLIGFPGRLTEVLKMELMTHDVHLFKAATLMNQVVTTFCKVSHDPQGMHKSLFVAGFGNTLMDVQAYHMAGLELSQIYLIDKKSRISCLDAWEQESAEGEDKYSQRRHSHSNDKISSDTFMVDESRMAEDSSRNKEGDEQCPVLKAPMARKSYKKQVGTVFQGYRDESLVLHVLAEKVAA